MSADEGGGSSPWKWIGIGCGVIALIGACTLGSCLACGGVGAVGIFAAVEAPANEAKGLLADVRAQRFDAAYARMGPTYQATHDVAAFIAQVQAIPAMVAMTDDTISQRNVSNATARMSGTLQTPSGDVPVAFVLSQLGERWVVDQIDVGGATIP